jgi:hypothetical protein
VLPSWRKGSALNFTTNVVWGQPGALATVSYYDGLLLLASRNGNIWFPSIVTGTMSNSFLSGGDFSMTHSAWPGNTFLGDPAGARAPYSLGNCPVGTTKADYCSDWDGFFRVDPEYRFLLAADRTVLLEDPIGHLFENKGNFKADEQQGCLEPEIEQWMMPNGYRPESGDRVTIIGRWVVDCGHNDFHSEIHPVELVVSSFLQTGVLPTGGVFDTTPSTRSGTRNFPAVVQAWNDGITSHIPATVNKVVVTQDWQGRELNVDLWPPPRPSATSILHYYNLVPNGANTNVDVEPTLEPLSNFNNAPNHVHLRITLISPPATSGLPDVDFTGAVEPQTDRSYAGGFLLWWEESCPTCVDNNGRGSR